MKKAEMLRIDGNKAEYIRLSNDGSYTNVKFDDNTGGLLATIIT
jgi:hypothetical protein